MNDARYDIPKPSRLLNILHIYALSGLVLSFPLLSFLAANPSYFVTNDVWPSTIYILVFSVSIVIPTFLAMFTMPFLVPGEIRASMHWLVHRMVMTVLIIVSFLQFLRGITFVPGLVIVFIAIVLGVLVARHYTRNRFIYVGFAFLFPLAFIFPIHFLLSADIQQILNQTNSVEAQDTALGIDEKPPIVFVVFDEFPQFDLLDAEGAIDRDRYPNFAAFADESTWYPYATTVNDFTLKAVPAILSGMYPSAETVIPIRQNYPDTLFTLLENHYTFHTYEAITKLSDEERYSQYEIQDLTVRFQVFLDSLVMFTHATLPKSLADEIAPMEFGIWGGFMVKFLNISAPNPILNFIANLGGVETERKPDEVYRSRLRKTGIDDYYAEIGDYPRETVHVLHMLIPHGPCVFLPSGRIYNYRNYSTAHHYQNVEDPILSAVHRRHAHLLQTGYADVMFGDLVDALKAEGLYEDSLIAIVADHGAYYDSEHHRELQDDNIANIAFVPMMIKLPGQVKGIVDRSNAQTIDLVPTIVDALDLTGGHVADGRSLIDPSAPVPETKQLLNIHGDRFELTKSEYESLYAEAHLESIERFSLGDPRATPFHFGPALEWIDRSIDEVRAVALKAEFSCPTLDELRDIDLENDYLPLRVYGPIDAAFENELDAYRVVACVNRTVQGATVPFSTATDVQFDLILPDSAFRNGENDVELFLVPRN